ncbi:hypothetical protein SLEP1_g34985 [Rubroshorea leprosula]|uniref:Uncharacterized protein n=1 Tax=Rubroshorea leprosula TaxID=152421 RepID=A0AAV5KM18_9ROSI|nr:hypothetical protein SLEP1_g34985 [Rubroshorea leprosula]
MLGVGSLFALISLFHILWIHRRFSKRGIEVENDFWCMPGGTDRQSLQEWLWLW